MPSFDIVNQIDAQEIDNALNNTRKTIATRYDFRGSETTIDFDKKVNRIQVTTGDSMKMRAVEEMLNQNFSKRGINPKALDKKDEEPSAKGGVRKEILLKEGIDKETSKKIVKMIKEMKLKVQPQIQDEQVRVTGKKIDDLQEIIALLKGKDLEIPLQFINMKS
jgi:hypothetical protein